MPDIQLAADIQSELAIVRASIRTITGQVLAGEDIGQKNVAYASTAKLEALYKREQYLEGKLREAERGGGIRVRYGVMR